MHKVETILFGIALILFGIASLIILDYSGWGFFEVTGIVSPILGIVISIIGVFYEGKPKYDNEEE